MQKYTVQNVLKTGKTSPKYGTEFYVKFAESPETVTVWRTDKNTPAEGQEWEGTIEGNKFVKKPFVSGQTESGAKPKRTFGAIQADKNDGQRQGMCINNAANFVNGYLLKQDETVTPQEWAEMVHVHAQALYALGNLDGEAQQQTDGTTEEVTDLAADVKNIFGA